VLWRIREATSEYFMMTIERARKMHGRTRVPACLSTPWQTPHIYTYLPSYHFVIYQPNLGTSK
jgi:hypothetical protein